MAFEYKIDRREIMEKNDEPVLQKLADAVKAIADKQGLSIFMVAMKQLPEDENDDGMIKSVMLAYRMTKLHGMCVAEQVCGELPAMRDLFEEHLRSADKKPMSAAKETETTVH